MEYSEGAHIFASVLHSTIQYIYCTTVERITVAFRERSTDHWWHRRLLRARTPYATLYLTFSLAAIMACYFIIYCYSCCAVVNLTRRFQGNGPGPSSEYRIINTPYMCITVHSWFRHFPGTSSESNRRYTERGKSKLELIQTKAPADSRWGWRAIFFPWQYWRCTVCGTVQHIILHNSVPATTMYFATLYNYCSAIFSLLLLDITVFKILFRFPVVSCCVSCRCLCGGIQ